MKIISLFDGISCGRVALEEAGIPVEEYKAWEIEKSCILISENNYKDIEHMGSVVGEDWSKYKGYDLLLGGSPCQDLSIQRNNREGLKGEKSSLFWEYYRALKEIEPKWFLFENVAKMPKRDKEIITSALGVEPVKISSKHWLPQNRERLYWTNIPIGKIEDKPSKLRDLLEEEVDPKYFVEGNFTFTNGKNQIGIIDISKNQTACRVYREDGVMPTLTTTTGGNQEKKIYIERLGKVRKLTPIEYERLMGLKDNYTIGVIDSKRYEALGNGWYSPYFRRDKGWILI